ncbi:MAG: hypothetical protein DDT39_00057 [Firmicutes bacterium]|nr:hypothetical protein [candidate division NPL-UPA2 bacterium]
MQTYSDNETDKFDPTQLDRGDTVETARDEKGRFASKSVSDASETDDKAETEAETADKAETEAETEAEIEAETETEVETDDETDGKKTQKDDKNYAIRLAKAKAQRDTAREQAEALAARLKAVEDKLAAQEGPKTEPRVDPRVALEEQAEGLYEKVEAARADGDVKQAATLQRELDKVNRDISRYEAAAIAGRTTARLTESQQYNAMLDVAEAAVDELNPASPQFEPDAVQQLTELVEMYEARGLRGPAALAKAAKAMYRIDLANPPKAALAPNAPSAAKPDVKTASRKPNMAKAIEAAGRQPPDTSGRGVNHDPGAVDVRSLSEDDFNKLPESKKRQLRGDDM